MNAKKLIAMILALLMVVSMAACGTTDNTETTESTAAPTTEATEPATDPVPEVVPASVDFEDGNMGFVALYEGRANADASTLELVDYNGSKALKVTNGSGKVPYVAIDVWSLLGEAAASVASIEMTMGIENPDGEFYACSGQVMLWESGDLSKTTYAWSVYLETKNPKVATVTLKDQVFSAENSLMVINLNTDNGATAGVANANLYIDDIRFLDASGNLLTADTTVTMAEPDGFGGEKDMSNLVYLAATTVSLDGMAGKTGTGWYQDGVEMTEEFLAALVPGAVIEIEFSSTAGNMWLVFPDSAAGWQRIQQQTAATNNSKNIAQITYEEIAAVLGEDTSAWGARLQCESEGDWEVYSVKVGQNSGLVKTANKTTLEGFACTGTAWGQNGFELTEEQWALLKPGSVIEIEYTSTTGDMWIVMPDSAAGWMRINADNGVKVACNGTTAQITYEQIASVCGDDITTWGARMQFESSGDWEVYAVSVCAGAFVDVKNPVVIDGFACTGTGWAQNGFELTAEQLALLVPGSVIEVQYTSANGDLWAVMPWSAAGWMRINADNGITPVCDGTVLQVTYEQIASLCGEDVSTWGTMLQFEASGDWEVYSVSIGTAG